MGQFEPYVLRGERIELHRSGEDGRWYAMRLYVAHLGAARGSQQFRELLASAATRDALTRKLRRKTAKRPC